MSKLSRLRSRQKSEGQSTNTYKQKVDIYGPHMLGPMFNFVFRANLANKIGRLCTKKTRPQTNQSANIPIQSGSYRSKHKNRIKIL